MRALISPAGVAAALYQELRSNHLLVTSAAQLQEILKVIARPSLVDLHKLSTVKQRRFISRIYKSADVVELPSPLPRIVPYDANDDPIVVTAVAGRSNVLCTLDRHFFHPEVVAFCAQHQVRVMRDTELLVELRRS